MPHASAATESGGPFGCVSLVTTDSYVVGAVVLGESIRRSGWKHDTLVLVAPEVSPAARERLAATWNRVIPVEHVPNPFPPNPKRTRFQTTFTKLRIWEQTGYRRLVYLDADTLVVGSIDELLERPRFAAAPCMWLPDYFNAGVLVIEPSAEVFADMLSRLGTFPIYDESDQGFLNVYFREWFTADASWRLPAKFNLSQFTWMYAPSWTWTFPDLRVLHYTKQKPWQYRSRIGRLLIRRWMQRLTEAPATGPSPFEMWWEVHDSMKTRT
jgi:alpha-N-acetylglucosamine transferase